jgi:hypothetical protein
VLHWLNPVLRGWTASKTGTGSWTCTALSSHHCPDRPPAPWCRVEPTAALVQMRQDPMELCE